MKSTARPYRLLASLLVVAALPQASAFLLPTSTKLNVQNQRQRQPLFLFGWGDDEEEKANDSTEPTKAAGIPRVDRREGESDNRKATQEESNPFDDRSEKGTATTAPLMATVKTSKSTTTDSPQAQAARLRAEAERARLEAERMDAALTLQKIERLEKELKLQQSVVVKASDDTAQTKKSRERIEDLQRQVQALLSKLSA